MKNKILLIDDDIIYRNIIHKILCSQYTLFLAEDFVNAMSIIEEGNIPNVVIADLNMPGIAGTELIRMLHKKLDRNIPIIVISGMDDDNIKNELLQIGIKDFLLKPIDRVNLKLKLKECLI